MCPANNIKNMFQSESHKSEKQLYLMWVMQNSKPTHPDCKYEANYRKPPEQEEQERILILELEAQLIH